MTEPKPWWSKSALSTCGLMPRSVSISAGGVAGFGVVALDRDPAARVERRLAQRLRGDRAADQLGGDRGARRAVAGAHVAGDERVDVAGDEDHVLDLLVADVGQQLLALLRVADPRVVGVVGAAEHARRHDRHLVGHHLPLGLGGRQRVLDPVHLRAAEHVARLVVVGARRDDRVVAGLVVAVGPLVHDDEVDVGAERELAVELLAAGEGGHVLEEGLAPRLLAREAEALAGRQAAVGRLADVVVLDLVVVPEHHHRELGVHGAQQRV